MPPWEICEGLHYRGFVPKALARIGNEISVELHFHPFEINPKMEAAGQEITEHVTEKYGITPAQANANRENIRMRGAQVGFKFTMADESGGGRSRRPLPR